MPVYTFSCTQVVQLPIEACWSFFSAPANLAKITPPSLRFTVRSELPAKIHPGLMIRYTVSPLWNIPMTWITEITQVRGMDYFVDEQRLGPYRLWHHEHFFRSLSAQQTEVRDLVHYVPPLGPLGGILNRLVIAGQITRIFDFRRTQLDRLFGTAAPDSRT